jgi:hypothetical protein
MLIGEKIFRDYVKYHTGYTGNIYTLWDFLRKTDFSSLTVYSIEFPLPENLEQAKRIYEKVRWIDSSYGNFIADGQYPLRDENGGLISHAIGNPAQKLSTAYLILKNAKLL